MNSQSRLVLGSPYHGNFNARAVDRTSMHIDEQALLMREDWAAFALAPNMSEQSSSSLVGWDIDDCQVKPGDRLYMFRQDPILPEMRIVPMTAIIPHYKDSNNNVKYYSQVDGVVQAVVPSDAKLLRSYSGGFVGKYIEELQCWEFVGISVGAQPAKARNMTILFIVRPPQEVLEWLAGGNVERTQSDPPATDAKSIER